MLRGRKLRAFALVAVTVVGTYGLAVIPDASAADCSVVVTLTNGQTLPFQLPDGAAISTLKLPDGTPISTLKLPPDVKAISESCPTSPTTITTTTTTVTGTGTTTTTTTTTTTGTTTTTTTTTSTTAAATTTTGTTSTTGTTGTTSTSTSAVSTASPPASTAPAVSGPGKGQRASHHQARGGHKKHKRHKHHKKHKAKSRKPKQRHAAPSNGGVPTPANPTFSFSLPGPAPIGVPNFFIDSFRIPPFLLPIYQAAGTEYEVPWQVLAAINEIETDYGRNLSVSSAGAVGWMQFLPSTWKAYAVDATGSGVADPYNPVDAIFTAAEYLHAAGASTNLAGAIFAYNHADWYVQSVLLRAKLIGGIPGRLIGALTGLVEGHFPVAAPAKYADDSVQQLATHRVKSANAAIPIQSDPNSTGVAIFAKRGSPVIAVNDGKIVALGQNKQLGRYLELQDSTGNVYTYAHLGSIPKRYPVPKPVRVTAAEIAKELAVPRAPAPKQPASAGTQSSPPAPLPPSGGSQAKPVRATIRHTAAQPAAIPQPLVKERLFAYPNRPASYAAGGDLQIQRTAPQITSFDDYFSDMLHLAKNQYTLQPLKVGSVVVAGTILGRIGAGTKALASHLWFMIRPAGKNAPYIDPKPILDGWKLLEATAVYRADGLDPFFGPGAKNPTIGQILLMSKEQLTNRILQDPHVRIYACGRRDIQAGLIDRRVLAAIEFLAASALDPTVSGLECGHSLTASTGVDAAGATGASVDISAINNIPVLGHQGPGSVTDLAIRRLLTLQGAMAPDEIVSLMSYKGQPTTVSLPDHANRIQVAYTPLFGENRQLSAEVTSILKPAQWIQLIDRINQIPEPIVPVAPSKYAIKVSG